VTRIVHIQNMPLKAESYHVLSILRETSARTACILKACLLSTLVLSVLLTSQSVKAEAQPIQMLNAGLNDAWFDPETDGQGFFITVLPDRGLVILAWFTYDTVQSSDDATANLGDAGHRWMVALGEFDGNNAVLAIDIASGGIFDMPTEINHEPDGTIVLNFESCEKGTVDYDITSIGRKGTIPIQRVAGDNIALCEALAKPEPTNCTRPESDLSQGIDNPPVISGAIVPLSEVLGGGPGPDGIPPLETPRFIENLQLANISSFELVAGVKIGDDVRAYPYNILVWHEVVNNILASFHKRGQALNLTDQTICFETVVRIYLDRSVTYQVAVFTHSHHPYR
jgi:hypothetical protein